MLLKKFAIVAIIATFGLAACTTQDPYTGEQKTSKTTYGALGGAVVGALAGGLIGGGAAMLAFGFSESIANWFSGTPVGDQFAALLGTFSLRPSGYLVLALQAVLIAAITAWASRRTLFATLDDID